MPQIPRQNVSDYSSYYQIVPSQCKTQQHAQKPWDSKDEHERIEKLNSLHSELRHLFSSSQVKLELEREQSYFEHVAKVRDVHEELQRRVIKSNKRDEIRTMVERERGRRLLVMESLLGSDSEVAMAMEKTNQNLNYVHDDLKAAFNRKRFLEKEKEKNKRMEYEENKEALLRQFRSHSELKRVKSDFESERIDRIQSFYKRTENADFLLADINLMNVQDELIKLYLKVEGSLQEKERHQINKTKDSKEQIQEQLIRQANREKAKQMSSEEQHNQMHSTMKRDEALEKRAEQIKRELYARKRQISSEEQHNQMDSTMKRDQVEQKTGKMPSEKFKSLQKYIRCTQQ